MRDRGSRHAARWAWVVSAGVHVAGFGGVWWLLSRPVGDESVRYDSTFFDLVVAEPERDDNPLRFTFVETSTPIKNESTPSESEQPNQTTPQVIAPSPPPSVLTPEVTSLIHAIANKPRTPAVTQDVVDLRQVEAAVPTSAPGTMSEDPTTSTPSPNVAANTPPSRSGRPVHGALPVGRSVVYVLDVSGTMGLDGKLDRARSALLATLALQSEGVRFQVVVYHGTARVLSSNQLGVELAAIRPSGASRHAEGVRVALLLNPDDIVLFTDAPDDELDQIRPILRGARKPTSLHLARVGEREITELVSYPNNAAERR